MDANVRRLTISNPKKPTGDTVSLSLFSFYLLVLLSGVPKLRQMHQVIGVPDDVTAATCGDIASRVAICRTFNNGAIGASPICVNWFRHHTLGTLFQFGRLQFHITLFGSNILVYRHQHSGETLMLAEPGFWFEPSGYYDGTDGKLSADSWQSIWEVGEDGRVTANAIGPSGFLGGFYC